MKEPPDTSALIRETSPYLLQHAQNPVDWHAWNDATLGKAREENKLMIVSIGYSTCHWCHVMEHESFEDTAVAAFMNEHFICIKVDREERPDVDQVYMQAVQLMAGRGGWPLNCLTLPDGRPLFGGTYFPKERWMEALRQMASVWASDPGRCSDYAANVVAGMRQASLVHVQADEAPVERKDIDAMVRSWTKSFDRTDGGPDRAPKFPMPVNYAFLLRYAWHAGDRAVHDHVSLTLDKMAAGGIYDHLGGGFARYSTDALWKVPHFEKMLYDNAQLVSLYADAFRLTGKERYREVVVETLAFIRRELTDPGGGMYSALDADSEGEEGRYYVWTRDEVDSVLGSDAQLFAEAYGLDGAGLWEHGRYVLLRTGDDRKLAQKHGLSAPAVHDRLLRDRGRLFDARNTRVRPGLDDKIITAWNALAVSACCHAFQALGDAEYLHTAEQATRFIETNLYAGGRLLHSTHPRTVTSGGKQGVPAFLDDIALMAAAYIDLYQSTFDERYLNRAERLAETAMGSFFEKDTGRFRYSEAGDDALIVTPYETEDNVIPSSSSAMARVLFYLSRFLDKPGYEPLARNLLAGVRRSMLAYPSAFGNWAGLALDLSFPFQEIAITGSAAASAAKDLRSRYLPNTVLAGSAGGSDLPLLKGRFTAGRTQVFVCTDKRCSLPVGTAAEAEKLLER